MKYIEMDRVSQELLRIVIDHHPLPWRIESDWGQEVLDANNKRVSLFRTLEEAERMVAWSEEFAVEDAIQTAEFLQHMQILGIDLD